MNNILYIFKYCLNFINYQIHNYYVYLDFLKESGLLLLVWKCGKNCHKIERYQQILLQPLIFSQSIKPKNDQES